MTITDLPAASRLPDLQALQIPDAAQTAAPGNDSSSLGFGSVLDAMNSGGAALEGAAKAENAFIDGSGGLAEMVFERAKADALVSVAAAATSRVAQSLNTLSQMQL
jgi:flagellar hook-basal body complex protein FliE